jgi:DNA-binding beta-propeller fold protein YncE
MRFTSSFLLVLLLVAVVPASAQYVIVSSDFNDSVQKYDLAGHHLGSFVPSGGGGLDGPQGITVGPDGNVYVSSANTDQVLKYNGATGAFLGAIAGGGLDQPWFLTFGPDHNLYVSSSLTSQVLCFDQTGAFLHVAAAGGGLFRPDGLSFDHDGSLLVSDFYLPNSKVKRYNPANGNFLSDAVSDSGLRQPLQNRLTDDGTTLVVSSYGTSQVRKYSATTGAFIGTFAASPLNGPVGQLVLPNGDVIVSSWNNSSLLRFNNSGDQYLGIFSQGDGLDHPNNLVLLNVPEPSVLAALGVIAGILAARPRSCGAGRSTRASCPTRSTS